MFIFEVPRLYILFKKWQEKYKVFEVTNLKAVLGIVLKSTSLFYPFSLQKIAIYRSRMLHAISRTRVVYCCMKPNLNLIQYLAGILDGEGAFYPLKTPGFRIQATNTSFELILWLQREFGGTVSFEKQPKTPNRQRMGQWAVCSQSEIYRLLLLVEPYLIVKRSQAKLILEYYRRNPLTGSGRRISAARRAEFLEVRRQLRTLNGRYRLKTQ